MSIIININIDCIYLYATKNTQIILQETRALCVCRDIDHPSDSLILIRYIF